MRLLSRGCGGAVYGEGDKGAGLALMMKQWSSDVLLFTDGLSPVSSGMLARLDQQGIGFALNASQGSRELPMAC